MTRKTGLLGGAFNPPHFGHLRPARQAMSALGLNRVVFVPTGVHPFKGPERLAPVVHRLAMLRLALDGEPGFGLWEIEAARSGVSYTVETLEAWHRLWPDEEPVLLIGADNVRELHLWRAWRRIPELAHLCLLTRPGFDLEGVACPALEFLRGIRVARAGDLDRRGLGRYGFIVLPVEPQPISSTGLRALLSAGERPVEMTPEPVIDYVCAHGLYGWPGA